MSVLPGAYRRVKASAFGLPQPMRDRLQAAPAAAGLAFGLAIAWGVVLSYLVVHGDAVWAGLLVILPVVIGWLLRRQGNGFLLAVTVMLVIPYWYSHVWLIAPIVATVGLVAGIPKIRVHPLDAVFSLVVALFVASWLFHRELQVPFKMFGEEMLPFGFYYGARLTLTRATFERLQWVMFCAGVVAAGTVMYEVVRGVSVFIDPAIYQWAGSSSSLFRAGGTFGGSPTAAIVLSVVILSTSSLAVVRPDRRRLLFAGRLLILAAIAATFDRAGIIGLAGGSVVLAVLLPFRHWQRVLWAALAAGIAIYAVTISPSTLQSVTSSRIVTQGILRPSTLAYRQNLLADTLPLLTDSPSHTLFGRGFDAALAPGFHDSALAVQTNLLSVHGPNDDYLRAALEQGLTGLAAILAWLIGAIWLGVRTCRRLTKGTRARLVIAGLTGATVCYAISAAGHDLAHDYVDVSIGCLVTAILVSACMFYRREEGGAEASG